MVIGMKANLTIENVMVKVFIIMLVANVMKAILSMVSMRVRELIIIIMDVPTKADIKTVKGMDMEKNRMPVAVVMKVNF